jgi:ATP-dependent RNA helicase RhlB
MSINFSQIDFYVMLYGMNKTHLTKTRFSNLELSDSIIKSLKQAGFIDCTPIQDKTLPLSLRGKDIAGQAQTGTGKTAAFLLATFQHLINDESEKIKNPRALILAPTRELAIQIHKDALLLGKLLNLKYALIYGGTDYKKQLDSLKPDVDIIIGTPGRIIDFYRQNAFTLDNIQVSVLDEADRMFDLGFIKDIRFLLRRMPSAEKRLDMLFSATLSYKVTELAYEHMNNPVLVKIETEDVTSRAITQSAFCPANDQKIPLLLGLLIKHKPERCIVFVNTKRCAERLELYLDANDYKVAVLSGDVPQEKRQRLLNDFQENKVNLMIATDVAARGLHIPAVSHVINYDLPQDVEDYVHRIGRTARFGASGVAFSFICEDYAYSMPDIEDFIGEKILVNAITEDVLAVDIKQPTKRPPRKNNYQGKKPSSAKKTPYKSKNQTKPKATPTPASDNNKAKSADKVTNLASIPENPQ